MVKSCPSCGSVLLPTDIEPVGMQVGENVFQIVVVYKCSNPNCKYHRTRKDVTV